MRFVPQADPSLRFARFSADVEAAVAEVLAGRDFILGAKVAAFETAFASTCGIAHAVGVASGTDALALALRALGIGPGDEVVTVGLTFAGTAQAILHCGARPHFVDVDPTSRCMDPSALRAAINPRTAAILPVHLFGEPCDMISICAIAERHGLAIVEDCAQAHGASIGGREVGSFGHAAAYSFYPTKNLGCAGDGGLVTTRDAVVADRLRALRNYGFETDERISVGIGFNSRLDEVQAAILSALLPHLGAGNDERRALAARYRRGLRDLVASGMLDLPPSSDGSVYHQFAIDARDRDGLRRRLARAGIGTAIHYAAGLHRHPAFASAAAGDMTTTERLSATLLSLPIQPEVARDAVDMIVEAICSAMVAA